MKLHSNYLMITFWALTATGTCAQGTAFTYQGHLRLHGSNYTGTAEFQPTLWNAAGGGSMLAVNSPVTVPVGVTNGLFLLPLDFGPHFPGADRWLQLEVRTTIGSFTLLAPRQELTPTPYAMFAGNAASAAVLSGTISVGQLPANVALRSGGNTFTDAQMFQGPLRLNSDEGFSQSSVGNFFIDAPFIPGGRFAVTPEGRVGIGNPFPAAQLDLVSSQASARITAGDNANGAVLTLRNITASPVYLGAINFENAGSTPGQIGCLNNGNMIFRAGGVQHLSLDGGGNLNFGTQPRQMLNFLGTQYGIGVQVAQFYGGMYFRSDGGDFAWYRGGVHSDTGSGSGGFTNMILNFRGDLNIRGVFGSLSDRNAKQDFAPVNSSHVLEKVVAMPLSTWTFKTAPSIRHLGPMAQDFHAAFGLNGDDATRITTLDADGVALAAIQGLHQKLEGKTQQTEERIGKLEADNATLKREVAELKRLIQKLGGN